ncbi:MAG: hypothetical protein ABEI96_08710 [Haloarculaceae archaeon]
MTDNARPNPPEDGDALRTTPALPDAVRTTGAYEADDGVVFYDVENPLAWVQSDETLPLQELV